MIASTSGYIVAGLAVGVMLWIVERESPTGAALLAFVILLGILIADNGQALNNLSGLVKGQ